MMAKYDRQTFSGRSRAATNIAFNNFKNTNMIFEPIGFNDTKFKYDVDVLMPLIKAKIDTKIDIDAQSIIGTAPNRPPVLLIDWFHFTKYNGKIIIEFEARDSYVCTNLDNYENATTEWDNLIDKSFNKLENLCSHKISKLGLGNTIYDFGAGKKHLLRHSIIKGLKNKI